MTKSKAQQKWEQQNVKEYDFMTALEADLTRPWKCGIWDRERGHAVKIFASANTEDTAKEYMILRVKRNGGSIPHRFPTQEIGWWLEEK